ncbi:MAG: cytochrome C oxidase subunit IV family protein [Actinomycetia bacterium]|nr:cytochrome C oxidase subunit IV family protein [Actinomycetes bacterium]
MAIQALDRQSRWIVAVWVVLIATMAGSLVLRTEDVSSAASASIVAIAFMKVWLIGNYFMELNRAPRPLQLGFAAYVVVTCAALIIAFYR